MAQNNSINCNNGVRVEFVTSDSVTNMDVNMYRAINDNGEDATSLLAILQIRDGKIEVSTFSWKTATPEDVACYNAGLDCIKWIQEHPEILLGNVQSNEYH